jgi:hypothetical protein
MWDWFPRKSPAAIGDDRPVRKGHKPNGCANKDRSPGCAAIVATTQTPVREGYETGLEDRLTDLHSRVHRGAYRAEDRQGCDGPKAGGASVLDVASGLGLRAVQKFRFVMKFRGPQALVDTRESPEIAVACSKSPT